MISFWEFLQFGLEEKRVGPVVESTNAPAAVDGFVEDGVCLGQPHQERRVGFMRSHCVVLVVVIAEQDTVVAVVPQGAYGFRNDVVRFERPVACSDSLHGTAVMELSVDVLIPQQAGLLLPVVRLWVFGIVPAIRCCLALFTQ